jgi:hypothetical protein
MVSTLSEPRENSYIEYVCSDGEENDIKNIVKMLKKVGTIKTSKTFPSLCRATMDTAIANLETIARITTIDYNGSVQESGGDPVTAEIVDDKGKKVPVELIDNEDGTYEARFTAHREGTFCLKVKNYLFNKEILFLKNLSKVLCVQVSINCLCLLSFKIEN